MQRHTAMSYMQYILIFQVTVVFVFDFLVAQNTNNMYPEEILIHCDQDSPGTSKQQGIPQMKHYGGSIDTLAEEFNQTLQKHQPVAASYMLELYNAMQNNDGSNLRYEKRAIRKSDTIRSFLQGITRHEATSQLLYRYAFDVGVLNRGDKLRLAEVRLPFPDYHIKKKVRITLYEIIEVRCQEDNNKTCHQRDSVISQRVKNVCLQNNNAMVLLKVTKLVRRLVKSKSVNFTLELGIAYDNDDTSKAKMWVINNEAILVTFTQTQKKYKKSDKRLYRQEKNMFPLNRVIRAPNESSGKRQKKRGNGKKNNKLVDRPAYPCEKSDLMVDFEKIGWSAWVIFQKTFNAFQCVGSCSSRADGNPTKHYSTHSLLCTINN
ncbi:nodal homolog 3-A-like, partial [Saccoglossus kowalevskii]|uniref:Nodal homolog 3-A-like n=1 Tax=Saccoglossus kowalevskii TaxID=10224 RepID=A0ABM0H205_SACKO